MSAEITKKEARVVFTRENAAVKVIMYFGNTIVSHNRIWRQGDSLFFGNQEIKGSLYDSINASVEIYFQCASKYPHELKLLSFEKPKGDLLDIVKNVFCKEEEFSLLVEYESHSHTDLFECKDCG